MKVRKFIYCLSSASQRHSRKRALHNRIRSHVDAISARATNKRAVQGSIEKLRELISDVFDEEKGIMAMHRESQVIEQLNRKVELLERKIKAYEKNDQIEELLDTINSKLGTLLGKAAKEEEEESKMAAEVRSKIARLERYYKKASSSMKDAERKSLRKKIDGLKERLDMLRDL